MIQAKTHRKYLFTSLRYPGGKTSLFEFFDEVIQRHEWQDITYIEPYAGGAGAAVSLITVRKSQLYRHQRLRPCYIFILARLEGI